MSPRPSPFLNLSGLALVLSLLALLFLATIALPGPPAPRCVEEASLPPLEPADLAAAWPDESGVLSLAREAVATVNFLQVEVCNAAGQAVPQAAVTYYQESVIGFPAVALGNTSANGSFQSPALPPGNYRVRATAPGCENSAVLEVQVPALADERIQFALLPPRAQD